MGRDPAAQAGEEPLPPPGLDPAAGLDPTAVEAFDDGMRLYVAGDDAAAAERLAQAVAIEAGFAEARYVLGLAWLRLGDRGAGIAALRQVAATAGVDAVVRESAEKRLRREGV